MRTLAVSQRPALIRLGLFATVVLLAGCSYFKREWGRALPAATGLTEGQTRVEHVIHHLGPPNQLSALPDGCVFLYEHSLTAEFQLGISLDLPTVDVPMLDWFKLVLARNYLDQQVLLLTFDNEGVLRGIGTNQWSESLGGGAAIQFVMAVMSLSDVPALRRRADAHSWGRGMLQRPPIALNCDQSLRSGAHGVQQRLAPAFAGQSTLEMSPPKKLKQKKQPPKQ